MTHEYCSLILILKGICSKRKEYAPQEAQVDNFYTIVTAAPHLNSCRSLQPIADKWPSNVHTITRATIKSERKHCHFQVKGYLSGCPKLNGGLKEKLASVGSKPLLKWNRNEGYSPGKELSPIRKQINSLNKIFIKRRSLSYCYKKITSGLRALSVRNEPSGHVIRSNVASTLIQYDHVMWCRKKFICLLGRQSAGLVTDV